MIQSKMNELVFSHYTSMGNFLDAQVASEIFKFESVDKDDNDGPLVYYMLTLRAFGSSELKVGYCNLHFYMVESHITLTH